MAKPVREVIQGAGDDPFFNMVFYSNKAGVFVKLKLPLKASLALFYSQGNKFHILKFLLGLGLIFECLVSLKVKQASN